MTSSPPAGSDAAKPNNDIRVETEETGPVLRTVSVTVDRKRVRKAFDKAYRELGRSASVKGFRKGKAPRSVLEKLYGSSVPDEIERTLIQETLQDAVELSGVMPIVEPGIEAGVPSADADFEYTLKLEVKPEVVLPDFGTLEATKPAVMVLDPEIDQELESMRERHAALIEEPEDAQVAEGTTVNLDYEGRIDGELFEGGAAEGVDLEIGAGRMIPGFEDQLIGARAGENVTVKVTFPEDYGHDELNGKDAEFACTVHSLQRKQTPELDDEFAKDISEFESLDELREKVRGDITERKERAADAQLHSSLMESLIEKTPFEVPPGLVDRQLNAQIQNLHQQFQGQLPPDVLQAQLARMQEEGRPAAERRVKETFLLHEVATSQGFEVSPEEVDARFEEMAETQGMDVKTLKHMAEEHGWGDSIRSELLDKKAVDFLASKAVVSEAHDAPEGESVESESE
jgi:trigger factor